MNDYYFNLSMLLEGLEGTVFYTPLWGGNAIVLHVDTYTIVIVKPGDPTTKAILRYDGTVFQGGELMLYPSKEKVSWDNIV